MIVLPTAPPRCQLQPLVRGVRGANNPVLLKPTPARQAPTQPPTPVDMACGWTTIGRGKKAPRAAQTTPRTVMFNNKLATPNAIEPTLVSPLVDLGANGVDPTLLGRWVPCAFMKPGSHRWEPTRLWV